MSVPKIVEIMYAIYHGLSKRQLYTEYGGRIVNNKSGFSLHQILPLHLLPPYPPE